MEIRQFHAYVVKDTGTVIVIQSDELNQDERQKEIMTIPYDFEEKGFNIRNIPRELFLCEFEEIDEQKKDAVKCIMSVYCLD